MEKEPEMTSWKNGVLPEVGVRRNWLETRLEVGMELGGDEKSILGRRNSTWFHGAASQGGRAEVAAGH